MKPGLIPGIIVAVALRAPVSPLSDGRLPVDAAKPREAWPALEQVHFPGVPLGGYITLKSIRLYDDSLAFRATARDSFNDSGGE
ncbi:hypothetical protein [Caballeronia concitans]|uniref:Uncharacterized protein n=1 Tax=Caballeronia concitans TaxID=1777133 RepID=A0A658R393_9BURK|nr:hypothetical protein [Caballeronia concitans]KIG01450.1 hypothetical protein BurMR1_1499 [Burkholderia sp. MR1]SAL43675.1 hypothetical protein AWB72_04596 [Caballeronia concitans]